MLWKNRSTKLHGPITILVAIGSPAMIRSTASIYHQGIKDLKSPAALSFCERKKTSPTTLPMQQARKKHLNAFVFVVNVCDGERKAGFSKSISSVVTTEKFCPVVNGCSGKQVTKAFKFELGRESRFGPFSFFIASCLLLPS